MVTQKPNATKMIMEKTLKKLKNIKKCEFLDQLEKWKILVRMVPNGTIWYHIVPYGTIWYHMVPYGTIWYHMVPLWYHYGTIMVPLWYHYGTIMVPLWYH